MRVLLGLIVLGCSETAPVPAAPAPVPKAAADLPQAGKSFTALGMVRIPGGVVELGPRHAHRLPPKAGMGPPPKYVAKTPSEKPASAWYSRAGLGLDKRMAAVAPFLIDQTEVTQAAYAGFVEEGGYRPPHVSESWQKQTGIGRARGVARIGRITRSPW